jgi:ParB-like chromosome segregation protein Spo0J
LRPHPQAGLVPAITAQAYQELRADIERRGPQVPLDVTGAGTVLDGHLRLRAATDLGLERVPVRVLAPADEAEYLLLAALERRQLTPSQRAALVLELDQYRQAQERAKERQLANLKQQPAEVATLPPRGKTRELAAGWAGVSARTLQDAATVKEHDRELFARVKAGDLAAAPAARRVRRAQRDRALPPAQPLPEGPFELIYADPPWQLGSPDSEYAPENHYPTMATEEISALAIPAAKDAVLFLWAVNFLLPQALEMIRAWASPTRRTPSG